MPSPSLKAACYQRQGHRGSLALVLVLSPWPAQAITPSILEPRGINAALAADLSWVLILGAATIFLMVLLLVGIALWGPPAWRAQLGRHGSIVGWGFAFPVLVLSALLFYTFSLPVSYVPAPTPGVLRIEVAGEQWWWRVSYPDETGLVRVATANEIHIPTGQPVEIVLTSNDVLHSFWVPNLAGKVDMIPGRTNVLRLQASSPGVYRGECAEYCGPQHAKMAFYVVAEPPEAFQRWLSREAAPANPPATAQAVQGQRLFMQHRCMDCHAVRGTAAEGRSGPDLTHIGSRRSLGAAQLPNNIGTLGGWIGGNQAIKPGNLMPEYHNLSGEELVTLSAYLEGLR